MSVRHKDILKCTLNIFLQLVAMYWKSFVCLCTWILSSMHTIFNTKHSTGDLNSIYQFQDIWRILTRSWIWTNAQTYRQTECTNTFQRKRYSNISLFKDISHFYFRNAPEGMKCAVDYITRKCGQDGGDVFQVSSPGLDPYDCLE